MGDDLWFVPSAAESGQWPTGFVTITPDGSTAFPPDMRDVAQLLGEERIAGMLGFQLTEVVPEAARRPGVAHAED